ncbi:MAG: ABC transporter ATP-binding protein, partial [Actinobacteria bacterium]
PEPAVVLLDEPFASLDAGLRVTLREEIIGILRRAGASALLVTHDQEEALSLADSVTVMREGRVEQAGPPEDVYGRPTSRWVAEFLGAADIVPGRATEGIVDCELGRFPADRALVGDVDVVVRPEALRLLAVNGQASDVRARVLSRSFHGHDVLLELALPSGLQLRSRTSGSARWQPGDEVSVAVDGAVSVLPRSG